MQGKLDILKGNDRSRQMTFEGDVKSHVAEMDSAVNDLKSSAGTYRQAPQPTWFSHNVIWMAGETV